MDEEFDFGVEYDDEGNAIPSEDPVDIVELLRQQGFSPEEITTFMQNNETLKGLDPGLLMNVRGGANFMKGDPRGENVITLKLNSGKTVNVNSRSAEAFKGFLNELEGTGYPIKSLGGHNLRPIRGGTKWSQHAYGNAIDINPDDNPMQSTLRTNLPGNVSDMAAKYGLSWGGDWKGRKDAMHFEWMGGDVDAVPKTAPQMVRRLAGGDSTTQELSQKLQALAGPVDATSSEPVGIEPVPFIMNEISDDSFVLPQEGIEPPATQTRTTPLPVQAFNDFLEWWNKAGAKKEQVYKNLAEDLPLVDQTLNQLKRGGQFAYQGLLDATGSAPTMAVGGLTGLTSVASQHLSEAANSLYRNEATPPKEFPDDPMANATSAILSKAQQLREAAKFASGVDKPETLFENVSQSAGFGTVPGNLPLTATMIGGDLANRYVMPYASDIFGIKSANASESIYIDALMRQGVIRPVAVMGPDGQQLFVPGVTENGMALTDDQAVNYWTRGVTHTKDLYNRVQNGITKMIGPGNPFGSDEIIQTAGGPYRVSRRDLNAMGMVGAATIGMMFLPQVARAVGNSFFPRVRPVPVHGGPQGLMSTVTRRDYLRAVGDDLFAPLTNEMKRNAVPAQALNKVRDTIRIQGGGAANVHIANAIRGNMELPNFKFKVPVSVEQLKKQFDAPHFKEYLHVRDTLDELYQIQSNPAHLRANLKAQNVAVGPPQVRGHTVSTALQWLNSFEQAHPEARELSQHWRKNIDEVRRFLTRGEYSTMSNKEYQRLRRERPNFVPWQGRPVTDPVNANTRGSPFDAVQDWMQSSMYRRMANEVRGQYVDALSSTGSRNVIRVPTDVARRNDFKATEFPVHRRGIRENWNADPLIASIMRTDPYYMAGQIEGVLDKTRRMVQTTTTGTLAPQFAPIAGMRNFFIASMSPEPGMKPPGLARSIIALPQQVIPATARSISQSLEHMNQYIGSTTVDALSQKLARVYEDSFYALMERGGMSHGPFMSEVANVNDRLGKWVSSITPGPMQSIASAYKEFLSNIHNAPGFAYAYRNRAGFSPAKLAQMQRDITGDPFITGALFEKPGKTLRAPARADRFSAAIGRSYGGLASMRHVSPWFNISIQGAKRVGQAYWQNPIGFTGRLWMYGMLPATLGYWWNQLAGVDPNGLKYSDYQMNLRNNYNTTMLQYVAIPGKPAADGIELPIRFHETAIAPRMMEVALEHLFGSNVHDTRTDAMNALRSWGDIIAPTSLPPFVTTPMAAMGQYVGGGPFSGYYTSDIKDNPFDADKSGWNRRMEMVARQLAPGMADWIGQAASAYAHTPEQEGKLRAALNASKQGGQRLVEKTPVLRDITGMKQPMSGSNATTEELFKKSKSIRQLIDFIKATDDKNYAGGQLSTKPRSSSGGKHVDAIMGGLPVANEGESASTEYFPRIGIPIAEPTNPLYKLFMQDVIAKFQKDAVERNVATGKGSRTNPKMEPTGGIGYQTLWKDYGFFKNQIASMRGIDAGNFTTWRNRMDPNVINYLLDNEIDIDNPRAVQNFLEQKRQEYARQILFTIRAVEQEFTQRLADPNVRMILEQSGIHMPDSITIESLSPYQGKEAPDTWGLKDDL